MQTTITSLGLRCARQALDFLLPHQCPLCLQTVTARKEAGDISPVWLCDSCSATLPYNHHACRCCALPMAEASIDLCAECLLEPKPYERAISVFRYEGFIVDAISAYKQRRQLSSGRWLSEHLSQRIRAEHRALPDCIVPVPMHWRAGLQRGFNQSQDIARAVGQSIGLPVRNVVEKTQPSSDQKTLTRRQRLANVRERFRCVASPPPRVALLDDVMTTGATARGIAEQLKLAGAETIELWMLARTPKSTANKRN